MSAAAKGKTVDEVKALIGAFEGMMSLHESALDGDVKLGDLGPLRNVVKFPVRIKCATLARNTLIPGLDEATVAL